VCSSRAGDHDGRLHGGEHRREVLRRIGLAQRATDRAAVAHDGIGDDPFGVGEDREVLGRQRGRQEVGVAGHGTDAQLVALDADVGEVAQVVDVDEDFGPGQAQLHHRQQAVPSGDDARLGPVPLEQRDGVAETVGPFVLERCGKLHPVPLRRRRVVGRCRS
jgi:hypothetical protein